jgi:hypothetical protein
LKESVFFALGASLALTETASEESSTTRVEERIALT